MRCGAVFVEMSLLIGLMAPVAAQQLALWTSTDTRIVLDLRRRQISVIRAGQSLGPWPVAIGDPQTPTPKGTLSIVSKQVNPVYLSTKGGHRRKLVGPSSPIGDRYLGFHRNGRGEYGIHGTPWPHWVRSRAAVSLGCVRMLNTHIRELFEVVEVGTPLQIRG